MEFVKKVYMSESVGPNSRGMPLGRWRDGVKEYMCEREMLAEGESWIKQGGSAWIGRRGDSSAVATLLVDVSGGSEAPKL